MVVVGSSQVGTAFAPCGRERLVRMQVVQWFVVALLVVGTWDMLEVPLEHSMLVACLVEARSSRE